MPEEARDHREYIKDAIAFLYSYEDQVIKQYNEGFKDNTWINKKTWRGGAYWLIRESLEQLGVRFKSKLDDIKTVC